jgi:hypothetical protein
MGSMVRDGLDGIVFKWRAGAEKESLAAALERATAHLPELRVHALETRARLLAQDNFGTVERLLLQAAESGLAMQNGKERDA